MVTVIFEQISWVTSSVADMLSKKGISTMIFRVFGTTTTNIVSKNKVALKDQALDINYLPDDCLIEIFKRLHPTDLLTCRQVCQRWNELLEENTSLWKTVCIGTFSSTESANHRSRWCLPCNLRTGSSCANEGKHRVFVEYLVEKEIPVDHLIVNISPSENSTLDSLKALLQSDVARHLTSVTINWALGSMASRDLAPTVNLDHEYKKLTTVFQYLANFCPWITKLDTDILWTTSNISLITSLQKLWSLTLWSSPPAQHLSKFFITRILQLPLLQKLKLSVTILPVVYDFVLQSNSLCYLDLSNCMNLLITDLDLPQLHTFTAFNFDSYKAVHNKYCLWPVIINGCPRLNRINGLPFSNTLKLRTAIHICTCKDCKMLHKNNL